MIFIVTGLQRFPWKLLQPSMNIIIREGLQVHTKCHLINIHAEFSGQVQLRKGTKVAVRM